jgi:hypothetical protein
MAEGETGNQFRLLQKRLASRMRVKQMERSGVPAFLCHEAGDFAKLPSGGEFWD